MRQWLAGMVARYESLKEEYISQGDRDALVVAYLEDVPRLIEKLEQFITQAERDQAYLIAARNYLLAVNQNSPTAKAIASHLTRRLKDELPSDLYLGDR